MITAQANVTVAWWEPDVRDGIRIDDCALIGFFSPQFELLFLRTIQTLTFSLHVSDPTPSILIRFALCPQLARIQLFPYLPRSVSLPFRLLLRCAGVEVILYNNSGRLDYLRTLISKQQQTSNAQLGTCGAGGNYCTLKH